MRTTINIFFPFWQTGSHNNRVFAVVVAVAVDCKNGNKIFGGEKLREYSKLSELNSFTLDFFTLK
jgi:hypothetical protein